MLTALETCIHEMAIESHTATDLFSAAHV